MNQRTLVFLPKQERHAVEAFVERVWQTYSERGLRIILFGSKARGDSHAHPDIDVLLIVNEEDGAFATPSEASQPIHL